MHSQVNKATTGAYMLTSQEIEGRTENEVIQRGTRKHECCIFKVLQMPVSAKSKELQAKWRHRHNAAVWNYYPSCVPCCSFLHPGKPSKRHWTRKNLLQKIIKRASQQNNVKVRECTRKWKLKQRKWKYLHSSVVLSWTIGWVIQNQIQSFLFFF